MDLSQMTLELESEVRRVDLMLVVEPFLTELKAAFVTFEKKRSVSLLDSARLIYIRYMHITKVLPGLAIFSKVTTQNSFQFVVTTFFRFLLSGVSLYISYYAIVALQDFIFHRYRLLSFIILVIQEIGNHLHHTGCIQDIFFYYFFEK